MKRPLPRKHVFFECDPQKTIELLISFSIFFFPLGSDFRTTKLQREFGCLG